MATAANETRKTRTSTPRNKSGCIVCRKRHIKCDEARPSCLKCTRAGWTCSYPACDTSSKAPGSRKNSVAAVKTLQLAPINRYAIPFKVPGSQKDRQVLHYYCVQGSDELAGLFNLDFWSRVVLQQSHSEPVVRQALVSLGMLHLEFTTTDNNTGVEVLNQYGKTLRMLKRRLDNADAGALKTAIVCCILFCCFEAACNNYNAATSHLQNGLSLMSSFERAQKDKDKDFDVLARMLEGLDVQASLLNDARKPQLPHEPDARLPGTAFSTLDEAYQTLMRLKNGFLSSLITASPQTPLRRDSLTAPALTEKDLLLRRLHLWLGRFENSEFIEKQETGAQMLLFHYKVADMFLTGSYPANATAVFEANPNTRAREILDLAEDVLRRTGYGGGSRRSLSSETGVAAPLFAMAMKCSDDHVRARALQLLERSDRREGLYDTQVMATNIQEVVAARDKERQLFNEQSSNELSIRHLDFLSK